MIKSGIYIIKNKINNYVYIGQSVNILTRWNSHKNAASNNRQDSYTSIHKAMKELGVDNFYIEILEECAFDQMDDREIYWIQYYDSYNNGYNMTKGGQNNQGENNNRALLTVADVEEIRCAYGNKIPFREVLKKYEGKISKRGLKKVWHYETWLNILPEVYTEENRRWHATYAKAHKDGNKNLGLTNQDRSCTNEEIAYIRQLRQQGLSYEKISLIVKRSTSVIRKYCLFQESKSPNNGTGIQIKNVETGLIFDNLTKAAKWASTSRNTITKYKNTNKKAGHVPSTGQPAHWITL